MKRLFVTTLSLLLGVFCHCAYADEVSDDAEITMLSSTQSPSLEQSTSLISQSQYNNLQRAHVESPDIGKVDIYTGKLNMNLPLIHVPMNDGLSFNFMLRYLTAKPSLASVLPDKSLEKGSVKQSVVGRHWQIFSGILDSTQYVLKDAPTYWNNEDFQRNFPVFYDPDGGTHTFYPRDGAYYSKDNWKAELVIARARVGVNRHVNVYSGTVFKPDGTRYIISRKADDKISTLDKVMSARGGSAIDYSYDAKHQNRLSKISLSGEPDYRVNFQYDTVDNIDVITEINTTLGERWNLAYKSDVQGNKPFLKKVILHDGSAWTFGWKSDRDMTAVNHVENPEGGVADYTYYSDPGSDLCGFQVSRYSVKTKVLSGRDVTTATWSYDYEIKHHRYAPAICDWRQRGQFRPGLGEHTTVTGPDTREEYTFGNGVLITEFHGIVAMLWTDVAPAADAGVIKKKLTYSLGGELLQKEEYTWQPRRISEAKQIIGKLKYGTNHAEVMEMTSKTVTVGGKAFRTNYSDFDYYGHPKKVVEFDPEGNQRVTHKQFYNNQEKWILIEAASQTEGGDHVENAIDESGLIRSSTLNGVTTHYQYDALGNLTVQTDALGREVHFGNYKRGIALRTEDALHNVSTQTVDAVGNVLTNTNGLGETIQYRYDALNRVVTVRPAIGRGEDIRYGQSLGPGVQWCKRGDHAQYTHVDGFSRKIFQMDEGVGKYNTVIRKQKYDALGRQVYKSYPYYDEDGDKSEGVYLHYDGLGREIKKSWPHGNVDDHARIMRYPSGVQMSVRDPRGEETLLTSNAFGDPGSAWLVRVDQPEGVVTTMTRNLRGDLLSVTQGDKVRRFNYNDQFLMTSVEQPEIGVTQYRYDILGNLLSSQVTGGEEVRYAYDALNQLVRTTYVDTDDVFNEYDAVGRLHKTIKGGINTQYQYSKNGLLQKKTTRWPGSEYFVSYIRDEYDNVTSQVNSFNGHELLSNFEIDMFGQPTRSNQGWAIYYFPDGRIKKIFSPGGVEQEFIKDDVNRIANISLYKRGWVVNRQYHFDLNDNMLSVSDALQPDYDLSLGYDGLNRLTSAVGVWGDGFISYDLQGNITAKRIGDRNNHYRYDDTGKLVALEGTQSRAFEYDVYGNVINNGVNRFEYTSDGNLHRLMDLDGNNLESYQYDPSGHRVIINDNETVRYELYDESGNLLLSSNSDNTILAHDLYTGGHLIFEYQENSQTNDAKKIFFHNDILGSSIAATNENGKLLWKTHYKPYGAVLDGASQNTRDNRYTGKVVDDDGLNYFGSRYYDPELGRFMAMDPLGFTQENMMSFNRYAYANDNPYRYVDPDGDFSYDFMNDINAMMDQVSRMSAKIASGMMSGMELNGGELLYKKHSGAWIMGYDLGLISDAMLITSGVAEVGELYAGLNQAKGLVQNAMYKSAVSPYKDSILTHVGRALAKHPDVIGETSTTLRLGLRTDPQINKVAAEELKVMMRSGKTSRQRANNIGKAKSFWNADGHGARFGVETKEFSGFVRRK